MTFGAPLALLLFLTVAGIAAVSTWSVFWQRRARARFAGPQARRWSTAASWPRMLLLLAGASLMVLAAARPQWGSSEVRRERKGVDLVIALDISQSMNATDSQPSRLGLAQDEIGRLLGAMRGSRIGLVFFSGNAIIRSPLTTDVDSVVQIVRGAQKEVGLLKAGTDVGAALDAAGSIFEPSDRTGKAILVVSDGEDFGQSAATKARDLASKGIAVFSAGVGTAAGSTIPEKLPNGQTRTKLDSTGNPVITHIDEQQLAAIASAGNGRYLHLGSSEGLVSFRDDFSRLDQTSNVPEVQRVPVERFQLFVAAGLALLALAWLLPEHLPRLALRRSLPTRAGSSAALVLLAVVVAGACTSTDPLYQENQAANRQYDSGDYQGALQAYEKLLSERPDLPALTYNVGNTLNRLGQYDRAIQETQRALPPQSTALGDATYYSLGNHYLALSRLPEAADAYRSALLLDPRDEDAKYNLEIVLALVNQQQPQPADQGAQQQGQQGQQGDAQQPDQQPGDQQQTQQTPGSDQQQPTATQPQGPPQQDPNADPAQVARSLQEALKGLDQNITFEDAMHILDLLRQQRATQQPRPGSQPQAPQQSGPDY